jgi:predicted nuclease with TOPRIM domain
MPQLDPAWIALIGTLCGGVGLKLLEHFLGKSKAKADTATQMRNELRVEVTSQKDEIRLLEEDLDKWKKEYYDLRDKYAELNTLYQITLEKIKKDATAAIDNLPPD